uniref:DUF5641 domain-containing protein n=1 Tax=Trichuris muris TaxID=70415 RepID=A0A5S6QMY1_TRIMR
MGCLRRRFRSEYLGQLLQRPNRGRNPQEIAIGDVVLVGSDNQKRLFWPLARVERLLPGKDGKPRVAVVRTATTQLMRPLQRLYPLEVSGQESVHKDLQQRLRPNRRSTELRREG